MIHIKGSTQSKRKTRGKKKVTEGEQKACLINRVIECCTKVKCLELQLNVSA